MFFKSSKRSTDISSQEFEQLIRRMATLAGDIDMINVKISVMTTNINSLRGFVNRKFGGQDEEASEEKTEKDKYSDFLPM